MQDYLIKASALEGLAELLDSYGVDAAEVLAKARITRGAAADPEAFISCRAFTFALELAAQASRAEHFGLLLARKRSLAVLGLLWSAMSKTRDVRSALDILIRYIRYHNEAGVVGLRIAAGLATLSYSSKLSGSQATNQEVDLGCAYGFDFMRLLCGDRWQPRSMHFVRSAPSNIGPFQHYFDCPVHFNSEFSGAVFDASVLDIKLADNDQRIVEILQQYLGDGQEDSPEAYLDRVRKITKTCMLTGDCSIDAVANNLSTSRRSLQRELADHDCTFKQLLEEVRFAEATRLLRESSISMNQIADILAYADLSCFSRAFSRRYSCSPKRWQAEHRKLL
jgi:AraC-like DNA-binding protein